MPLTFIENNLNVLALRHLEENGRKLSLCINSPVLERGMQKNL